MGAGFVVCGLSGIFTLDPALWLHLVGNICAPGRPRGSGGGAMGTGTQATGPRYELERQIDLVEP